MLLKCLANYVYTFRSLQGLPILSSALHVDLVRLQFVPSKWRCHQWKDPSGISLQSQEHGSRGGLGKRVLEWENKKQNKPTNPKSLQSWHLKSELSLKKGSEKGLGLFTTRLTMVCYRRWGFLNTLFFLSFSIGYLFGRMR